MHIALPDLAGKLPSVVPFNKATDRLLEMDFTGLDGGLTADIIGDITAFSNYVSARLAAAKTRYGIGGYNEHRTMYSRSKVFDSVPGEEPRRLHLGIDIWGPAGTPVSTPLHGTVHSFAFNDQFGDYGATLILAHDLPGGVIHSLYGHISLKDLEGIYPGKEVKAGELIAHFGLAHENGHWPPHLHFQLIINMAGCNGDYPGVCKYSERERYLVNSPDPDCLLGMMQYARKG